MHSRASLNMPSFLERLEHHRLGCGNSSNNHTCRDYLTFVYFFFSILIGTQLAATLPGLQNIWHLIAPTINLHTFTLAALQTMESENLRPS